MNKVVLVGRLTKDPELRFAAGSGTAVSKFGIAVTRQFKKDETDFINCIAFGKTAETISQYLIKGKQVALSGAIRTGSYDAKDGTKRYTTDVIVDSFDFIGSKDNSSGTPNSPSQENNEGMTPVDDGDMPF